MKFGEKNTVEALIDSRASFWVMD